ncbi:MAG: PD-(D/E)XK nuclease family protein [Chloroflexota bacterium]
MLKPGQSVLINKRRWHLRQVIPEAGRRVRLETVGTSTAAQGLTRELIAFHYGDDLFIEQRHQRYWRANLQTDWLEDDLLVGPMLQFQPTTWLDFLAVHTQYPASGDLVNELSWSHSRAAKYQTCSRAYYYHYYAAWEGWQADAPAPVKRAYLLKNLTTIPLWVGTIVHESIKFTMARLKAGQDVSESDLIKQMHTRAQADFETSQSGQYQQAPNQLQGFQAHYYQKKLPNTAWSDAWQRAEQALQTFMRSSLYATLSQQPASTFLDTETLQAFTWADTKIWVQIDLLCQTDQTIYIYDWKTGAIDEATTRQQLGVYALYVRQTWPEITHLPLKGVVYNLTDDQRLDLDLDESILQETQQRIETSVAHLRQQLLDVDQNLADIQQFPMIDDRQLCQQCQFRELCDRA